jgi:hypothetical protein
VSTKFERERMMKVKKEEKTDVEAERKRKRKGESSLRERKNYEHIQCSSIMISRLHPRLLPQKAED